MVDRVQGEASISWLLRRPTSHKAKAAPEEMGPGRSGRQRREQVVQLSGQVSRDDVHDGEAGGKSGSTKQGRVS